MTTLRIKLDEYEANRILDDLEKQGIPREFFQKAAKRFLELYEPWNYLPSGVWRYMCRRQHEPVEDARHGVQRLR